MGNINDVPLDNIEQGTENIQDTIDLNAMVTLPNRQQVTYKQLFDGFQRQEDYTRKTQKLSKEWNELGEWKSYRDTIKKHPDLEQKIAAIIEEYATGKTTINTPQN